MQAIITSRFGGPEVFRLSDVPWRLVRTVLRLQPGTVIVPATARGARAHTAMAARCTTEKLILNVPV